MKKFFHNSHYESALFTCLLVSEAKAPFWACVRQLERNVVAGQKSGSIGKVQKLFNLYQKSASIIIEKRKNSGKRNELKAKIQESITVEKRKGSVLIN